MQKSAEEIKESAAAAKLLNLAGIAAPEVIEVAAKHHLAVYGLLPDTIRERFERRFKRSMRDVGASFFRHMQGNH